MRQKKPIVNIYFTIAIIIKNNSIEIAVPIKKEI